MKRFIPILLVVLFVSMFFFVVPAFAQGEIPPPTSPVELPLELQALIAAGIGFLVTAGLKSLSVLLKTDISGWGSVITGGIVTSVVYFLNALLSAVPAVAQPSVAIVLTLLIAILSAFGVAATVKKFQPVQPVVKK
jgi:hypothetical protein